MIDPLRFFLRFAEVHTSLDAPVDPNVLVQHLGLPPQLFLPSILTIGVFFFGSPSWRVAELVHLDSVVAKILYFLIPKIRKNKKNPS